MRKTIIAVVTALSVAGCTVVKEVAPAPTQAPEATSEVDAIASSDDLFIYAINDEYPEIVLLMGEAWLIDLGTLMCQAMDEGMTLVELAAMSLESDMTPEQIGYIAGAAVAVYCPRHSDFFDGV